MDLALLEGIAQARPDWHLVIIGPVVKIDPALLPKHPNIHYLGGKSYQELPSYLAGWDVALLPKPVVSTSIRDVVRPYGDEELVHIADTVPEFVTAIEKALAQSQTNDDWLNRVDAFLSQISWDLTWQAMNELIEAAIVTPKQETKSRLRQEETSTATELVSSRQ
jgi:UDP-galactopyranose mutase